MTSSLRIIYDVGGTPLTLLDWDDRIEGPIRLPWEQVVDQPEYVEAEFAGVLALGGVAREMEFARRVSYASHHALQAGIFDHDEALPVGEVSNLHIRVVDWSVDEAETEANRTHAHYIAASASIRRAEPTEQEGFTAVVYRYTIALGALVKQP